MTILCIGKADCQTIPMSSEFSRFCLKIPNPDQYAIGIGKIPILTPALILHMNSYDTRTEYTQLKLRI